MRSSSLGVVEGECCLRMAVVVGEVDEVVGESVEDETGNYLYLFHNECNFTTIYRRGTASREANPVTHSVTGRMASA